MIVYFFFLKCAFVFSEMRRPSVGRRCPRYGHRVLWHRRQVLVDNANLATALRGGMKAPDSARLLASMTMRQVRYFVTAAETGQVSAAAAVVGISPSAITEAIGELERLVAVKLFTRHQRGLKLTYEGYRFLGKCRNILSAVKDASYALGQPHTDVSGRIRLATTITVVGYFLAPLLVRFQKMFPGVEVRVSERPREAVELGLVAGKSDLGIMLVSNLRRHHALTSLTLVQSRRRLWLSPTHRLLTRERIGFADIAREPYIQLMIDEAAQTTSSYWKAAGLKPKVILRTESVEAVRSLVASGTGVTILSDMVYRPWSLEGDRIEVREVSGAIPTMNIGIAWRTSAELDSAAQAFLAFCRMEHM
jgi:DNA-binding transcriptional LysR family regulator